MDVHSAGEYPGRTEPTYPTTDLDLVAFLACHGIEPREVRPPLPHSYPAFSTFVYAETSALETALDLWSYGEPLVDLREFLERRRDMYHRARAVREGAR